MRFRILGPLEIADGDRVLPAGGARQRALLAILLLSANEVVPTDRLIDELWGEHPPESGRTALQVRVSQLRKALGPAGAQIVTREPGYALQLGGEELDLHVFERLVGEAEAADPAIAATKLREALSLWRGPPLADLYYESFAQPAIARLEELRLAAIEKRIDCDLALGRHAALVGELEALVGERPLRERPRAQLMLALYRSGRQADALGAYRSARTALVDQLGIEPSVPLRELEQAILRHDPALELSPTTTGQRSLLAEELGLEAGPAVKELGRSILEQSPRLNVSPVAVPPVTLPVPPTPFIGRARELCELTALLRGDEVRLVTLTGAGGSGKTRLALRLAQTIACDYRDGTWFVGFADVTDPELIAPTLCQALEIPEAADLTAASRVERWLAERDVLLVLDNLEQLADGSAALAGLLSACPSTTLLVTSREPLRLAAEQQYEVPLLQPDDAFELFTARAFAVAPDARLDRRLVDGICGRLDRLPLAIELTAARMKMLSAAETLDRLRLRQPVIAAGPRDAPARQRTLKATIDWSYALLALEEKLLFERVSVFAGGFTFAAAEVVCEADLDTLQALVDRSLVRWNGDRYSMLQTIRDYAVDCLERSGEAERLRGRHAKWLVDLLEAEQLVLPGWLDAESQGRLAPEQANFTAALEWAARTGRRETLARLAGPLVMVWATQGWLHEADRWMRLVLEDRDTYSGRLAAQVLSGAAVLARLRGDYREQAALARRALEYWQEVGDARAVGLTLLLVAGARSASGDPSYDRTVTEEAIQFARDNALTDVLAWGLAGLADLVLSTGRLSEGRMLCEQGLAVLPPGSTESALTLLNLGYIETVEGRHAKAEGLFRGAVETAMVRGDLLVMAWAAILMAWPLAEQGQLAQSACLLAAGVRFLETSGVTREWMEQAGESAVLDVLHRRLDADSVEALLTQGRDRPLMDVARDVLSDLRRGDDPNTAVGARPVGGAPIWR